MARKAVPGAAFLVVILTLSAEAGMVGISPLRVEFSPDSQTETMQVVNTGPERISMQVAVRRWAQGSDGQDFYENTAEVIAVPPIFSLEPGEKQIIRVGMRTPRPSAIERSYRLFFTELPNASTADVRVGLRIRLQISIPVFAAPVGTAFAKLQMVDTVWDGDRLHATFRNSGNTHVRVEELVGLTDAGFETKPNNAMFYVLPGASRDVFLDFEEVKQISSLVAKTDTAGIQEYEVATE